MSDQVVEPINNTGASAFIGLQSYTEAQAGIFYGRDEEINKLTKLVQSNTLTIVFGKSGTGKTSLLNAGVFPKLRKDYCLPFRIRLEFQEDSPDLITQIKNVLKSEIDKYGFTVEHYPSTETLWQYFHTEPLWSSITPILVFDQFEEMFTLAKKSSRFRQEELAVFWEELSDLIENSIPEKLKAEFLNHKENIDYNYKVSKVKIVFAFREEFLPEFESITTKIPSIKYSRFRLMQMNGNQAYDVITKTWKNNIDPAQAKEIVSFFTNENDQNKSYDLIEIEPSLLSQVCAYIDKERIIEGNDKISDALLKKYPKEIILRSIYNEVLTESNNAIKTNENKELNKPASLVKEFVEDKLITDEGFRTKYALTEHDEIIRPAIEILKSKYFLRDDGKSVELTHDVLVPLIKIDREKRRKDIAQVIARKKANKRALVIIIISLLASALIWYLITYKAIRDKRVALDETEKLKVQLKSDSIKLASIGDSIQITQANLNLLKRNKKGNFPASDTSHSNTLKENEKDSVLLANLQNQYAELNFRKSELDNINIILNKKVNELTDNQNKTESVINELRRNVEDLKKLIHDDSIKFINQYDLLRREFNAYRLKNPEPYEPVSIKTTPGIPDSNSLQLNLYYSASKSTDIPGNLKIYLIPDLSYNKKIIRAAKVYEIHCNELDLDKAKGKKIAKFSDKQYSLPNVPPGKYFIKICAYYGGYYTITKKAIGNETIKLDLSPPIR